MAEPWAGAEAGWLCRTSATQTWRSHGDTVERLELLARAAGRRDAARRARNGLRPARCSSRSRRACARRSLSSGRPRSGRCCGRWMAASSSPGRAARRPAGAPTCCRPGATSSRSTAARCRPRPPGISGWKSAALLIERYLQEHGDWPRARGALGLGHGQHAHRRRRHRPGAGAARRAAGVGWRLAPGHRDRDPAARPARPAAGRRDAPGLRLLPRRLSGADRAVRSRGAGGRGARRARGRNPIAARVRADERGAGARRAPTPERAAPPRELSRVRLQARAPTAPACRR